MFSINISIRTISFTHNSVVPSQITDSPRLLLYYYTSFYIIIFLFLLHILTFYKTKLLISFTRFFTFFLVFCFL